MPSYPTPTRPTFDDPADQNLFDCILALMFEGFQNSALDPTQSMYTVAQRWTECFSQYIKEGPVGIDLDCIREYIGSSINVCDTLESFSETNYLQEATNLTQACIILDQQIQQNATNIQVNADDIDNIYNILDQQDPVMASHAGPNLLSGVRDRLNRVFTLPEPARNALGGREIRVWHNGKKLRQVSGTPIGSLFSVLDTGLADGFDTFQMGFAPASNADILVEYFPIVT